MAMTLLQIVAAVQAELGLFPVATAVAASTRNIDQQMLAILNSLGRGLVSEREWVGQRVTFDFDSPVALSAVCNITADNSNVVVVSGGAGLASIAAGTWIVSGGSLPPGARIDLVYGGGVVTSVDLMLEPTVTESNVTLTFARDSWAMPSDFLRQIPETAWDRTNNRKLYGPTSPQQSAALQNSELVPATYRTYQFIAINTTVGASAGQFIRLFPPPALSEAKISFAIDYVSFAWATDNTGSPTVRSRMFVTDTSLCIFPDALMVAGLKYRFRLESGFDAGAHLAEYAAERQKAIAQDGGSHTLQMGRRHGYRLRYPNVQEGNFPS